MCNQCGSLEGGAVVHAYFLLDWFWSYAKDDEEEKEDCAPESYVQDTKNSKPS